jgi:hypothetical protein
MGEPTGISSMKLTYGNILATYFLASESEIRQGVAWYDDANIIANRIADSYSLSSRIVAGVIAALSPSNKWERNIRDADNFCRVFAADGDPLALKVSTYGRNRVKALNILNGDDIDATLNGRKTVAFYHCIAGDDGHVCIDGHAYNIWMGERIPLDSVPSIGKGLYASIAGDYIQATTLINRVCQTEYTAAQVQAITWTAWRRMIGENSGK